MGILLDSVLIFSLLSSKILIIACQNLKPNNKYEFLISPFRLRLNKNLFNSGSLSTLVFIFINFIGCKIMKILTNINLEIKRV